MRTSEYPSFLKEGIKLGVRIAAPVALTWIARNSIHLRGKPKPLDPSNLPVTGIESEDNIISHLPVLLEAFPKLLVYHEPIVVVTDKPIAEGRNGKNQTIPDFVFTFKPLSSSRDVEGALVVETARSSYDTPNKRRQLGVLAQEGIKGLLVGTQQHAEARRAKSAKQVASALFGAFWPTNSVD